MARVAEGAGVAREALYRMLRGTGNPTYSSLRGILNAVGLRITFVPAMPVSDSPAARVASDAAVRRGAPKSGKTNGALGTKRKSPAKKRG